MTAHECVVLPPVAIVRNNDPHYWPSRRVKRESAVSYARSPLHLLALLPPASSLDIDVLSFGEEKEADYKAHSCDTDRVP